MADRPPTVVDTSRLAKRLVLGFLLLGAIAVLASPVLDDEIVHSAITCDRTETTDSCRQTAERLATKECGRADDYPFPWLAQVQLNVLHYSSDKTAGVPSATVTTFWCEDFLASAGALPSRQWQ